ncbi:MAG TPA: branched-chain amino acid ABC transporter substrate-binding protein [Aquabacterium sp.]|uniref:branched-chain amino acid ABC transporter substrate-binding protein n=1 Tax=Aquabacterium sp. TaxID=1872578 RepID=UPI002E321BE5|nr:branched-chain amino acid ABC transporter substrate-binding protein [Aquabacterium sp.]HEX5373193.1 branched-chain amino acid ABC transporter substrate-binding protein [Aquabacterium sp.]
MKRHSIALSALALVSLSSMAQDAVVRIGHVGPVSGAQAHYGRDNENGARMAVDELNAQGVKIGGKKVRFELIAEDDAADPKQGTAAAQKLCDAKVNGVVGHLNSGTTIPAAKVYDSCGLPMVTPSATNPQLTALGYKRVYRLLANDNALGAGLARHARDVLKLKKVAIIDDRTAYGKGVAEVFRNTARTLGMEVVSEQYTNDKAVDFTSILTSIKSKKPDGIFFGGMDPQAGPMLRQMQQLGLSKAYLFGGDGICTEKLAELSSGARTLGNVVCAVGGASLDKLPQGKTWRSRYDAKFPKQFQVYSPYTYDATMVLVDAMKRANSTDPKVYAAKLATTDYQGVTAKVQFEPNGELKTPAMTLYVYKDGKRVPIN